MTDDAHHRPRRRRAADLAAPPRSGSCLGDSITRGQLGADVLDLRRRHARSPPPRRFAANGDWPGTSASASTR